MKTVITYAIIACSLSTFARELTIENVESEIVRRDIKHGDIVLRQAILETGWFKSYNATVRNNLFGFWNSRRKQYFVFEKWEDSVAYYKRWQEKNYKGGDYYKFLDRIGYAEDPDYIWKLKNINI